MGGGEACCKFQIRVQLNFGPQLLHSCKKQIMFKQVILGIAFMSQTLNKININKAELGEIGLTLVDVIQF